MDLNELFILISDFVFLSFLYDVWSIDRKKSVVETYYLTHRMNFDFAQIFFLLIFRSAAILNIRRIQYAPLSPIENPLSRIIEHNFMTCTGNIELEASLDKSVSTSNNFYNIQILVFEKSEFKYSDWVLFFEKDVFVNEWFRKKSIWNIQLFVTFFIFLIIFKTIGFLCSIAKFVLYKNCR